MLFGPSQVVTWRPRFLCPSPLLFGYRASTRRAAVAFVIYVSSVHGCVSCCMCHVSSTFRVTVYVTRFTVYGLRCRVSSLRFSCGCAHNVIRCTAHVRNMQPKPLCGYTYNVRNMQPKPLCGYTYKSGAWFVCVVRHAKAAKPSRIPMSFHLPFVCPTTHEHDIHLPFVCHFVCPFAFRMSNHT